MPASLRLLLLTLFDRCVLPGSVPIALSQGGDVAGSVRVFTEDPGRKACYRLPAIVRTPVGTLLAFAEQRFGSCLDQKAHKIVVRRSTDGGVTWEPQQDVIGDHGYIVANPMPIVQSTGRVILVYCSIKPKTSVASGNGHVFSEDDGRTWSQRHTMDYWTGKARASAPGPGPGIEIALPQIVPQGNDPVPPRHRVMTVLHKGAYVEDYIVVSDNGGATWRTMKPTFPKMDEAALADLGNGEVLLNMRHQKEGTLGRAVSRSMDGGMTWSPITYDPVLIGPVCQGSMVGIDGSVYFANPASSMGRDHLTIRRSIDGGRTWKASYLVQAAGSFGYSSIVPSALTDTVHGGILYEAHTKGCIDFQVFPLDLGRPALFMTTTSTVTTTSTHTTTITTTTTTSTSTTSTTTITTTNATENEEVVAGSSPSAATGAYNHSAMATMPANDSTPTFLMLQNAIIEERHSAAVILVLWSTVLLLGISGIFCGAGCRECQRLKDSPQGRSADPADEGKELLLDARANVGPKEGKSPAAIEEEPLPPSLLASLA